MNFEFSSITFAEKKQFLVRFKLIRVSFSNCVVSIKLTIYTKEFAENNILIIELQTKIHKFYIRERERFTGNEDVRTTMLAVIDEEIGIWSIWRCILARVCVSRPLRHIVASLSISHTGSGEVRKSSRRKQISPGEWRRTQKKDSAANFIKTTLILFQCVDYIITFFAPQVTLFCNFDHLNYLTLFHVHNHICRASLDQTLIFVV